MARSPTATPFRLLGQVRVEISRRSVPKKLEGRYDEQSVAKSVELPLMELLVQPPAQPDRPKGMTGNDIAMSHQSSLEAPVTQSHGMTLRRLPRVKNT